MVVSRGEEGGGGGVKEGEGVKYTVRKGGLTPGGEHATQDTDDVF